MLDIILKDLFRPRKSHFLPKKLKKDILNGRICDIIIHIFTSINYTQDARFRQCRGIRNTPFFNPQIKFMHKPRFRKKSE